MVKEAELVDYKVTPEVLVMRGGDVDATISVNYPAKYFNKKAIVTLTPVLRYEGGETALEPVVLQGEKVTENNKPISWESGGSVSHSISFPFEQEMMLSELVFTVSGAVKDKMTDMGEVKLADGVVATAQMVNKTGKVISFGDKYEQIVPKSYEADIKYIINRADVRRSEMSKEEVSGIAPQVKETAENERLDLKGIEISAYASPDGELDLNTRLAERRQKSAEKYLAGQMKKSKLEVEESMLNTLSTPEDWEGFKAAMEASDIQDKEMILRVLSMHSDPVVREQEIKNLTAAYEVIAEEILPELRRSMFTVNMEKIGWSDAELKELWTSNPDTLVLEELLYTATLVDDHETKLDIYSKAAEAHPNCLRAHNNKGVVLFEMGEMEKAGASFAKAKALKEHDNVVNNMGAVSLKEGDVPAAKEAFTASLAAGSDVNYNLGTVNIIEGEYESALNYFGSDASFNAALVQHLNGDSSGAMRTLSNVEASPYRSYLMATISADQDKPADVYKHLGEAVKNCKSPEKMAEYAKKDIVFAKYFETAEFKAIVE